MSSDGRHAQNAQANDGTTKALAAAGSPAGASAGSGRGSDTSPSRDEVFDVLANQRRRYVLHYLRRQGKAVALGDLAERVAAWETEKDVLDLTANERKRIYTALQQFHLPKMDETVLLDYDRGRGTVSLADSASDLDVYLDVVPDNEIPWSLYYLGLSVLNLALLVGLWLDAFPLTLAPDLAWVACFVVVFTASAAVHVCRDRRMRLGASDTPPEVPPR